MLNAEATSDDKVGTNASVAAADVRNAIDHQVKAAGDFDTKLSALITVLGTAAGLAASRVLLDSQERVIASILSGLLVALTVGLAFNGLRPRAVSFGADPDALPALVTDSAGVFGRELLSGLVAAYNANKAELESKATSYERALLAFFLALLSIGPLIATGALR